MKALSIFSFLTLILCISIRLYSKQTGHMLDNNLNESAQQDIFSQTPEKARELLDTLDAVAFSDQPKYKKTKSMTGASTTKKHTSKELALEEIKKLKGELIEAFTLPKNNIDQLYEMQALVREASDNNNIATKNIETWGPDFIFYLLIKEGHFLEDLDNFNGMRELGFTADEIIKIKRIARSDSFMLEILLFKNAIDQSEYEQALAETKTNKRSIDNNRYEREKVEDNEDDQSRSIASYYQNEDFADYRQERPELDLETKLLEDSYNSEELEEIKYGYDED